MTSAYVRVKKSNPGLVGWHAQPSKSASSTIRTPPERTASHIRPSISTGCAQDETSVDDIVSSMVVPMSEIHGLESDVGQTSRCGGLTRQSELYVVHIDSGHQGWSNQRCDLKSDIASAATQVDRTHAGPQARPAQQGSCLRPPGSRENLEPVVSLLATPYDVALHERDYPIGVGLR